MSVKLEAFLAKIYVDAEARGKFLANPRTEATSAGLTPEETDAVEKIDRTGLEMTARSLTHKRKKRR